jgi:prolyl-tRNA synthetase
MRMSQRFGRTLREKPAEAEMPSHELLLRAGMISKLAAGIYSYLPLAWRSIRKIEDIMRKEMDAAGGQEINMPVVHPSDIWEESGRFFEVGPEMVRFKDRSGRDMVLAMTHEEPVTDLARRFIDSYKQLPIVVYHIQTKFRDEPRSRGGLVRVREFVMKDAYSFHADEKGLDEYYPAQCRAYRRICRSCGVPVTQVQGDVGMMGGTGAHEFTYVTDAGEDTLMLCPRCGYAANREAARIDKSSGVPEPVEGEMLPAPAKVSTPGKDTIASVCEFLGRDPKTSIKTMVYFAGQDPVMVVLRGDLDVNEKKLANLRKVDKVRLAEPEELKELGLEQGYMSPVGVERIFVVADDSLSAERAYVAGANESGYHLVGVVPGRDFRIDVVADIATAREGDPCPACGERLTVKRGVEVGNTFKLGTRYSVPMKAMYQDENGELKPLVMGCYGMGVGRLLACVIEANHDDKGIIWPMTVAPYHVHLVALGTSEDARSTAEGVYERLLAEGIEVLYDDRDESAGVKFNDADLLGMPIRVTVSERSLKRGGAEVKLRRLPEGEIVPLDELPDRLKEIIRREIERILPGEES